MIRLLIAVMALCALMACASAGPSRARSVYQDAQGCYWLATPEGPHALVTSDGKQYCPAPDDPPHREAA